MRTPSFILAGRPERFLALLVDNIILLVPAALINKLLGGGQAAIMANFLCNLAYFAAFTGGPWQATPGQHILSIRVVHTNGRPLHLRDAIMRYLAYVIPVLPLYTSLLNDHAAMTLSIWLCFAWFAPILLREDRAGMHDQLCNMQVVAGRP